MSDFILRQKIRKILSEFFNGDWVYAYGPNEFPKSNGDIQNPSDLDAKFDSEFNFIHNELEENEENVGLKNLNKKVKKK